MHDVMLYYLRLADALAELRDAIRHSGEQIDQRDVHRESALFDEGIQRRDVDIRAQVEVRIVEGVVDLKVLAARPGGQIDGAHNEHSPQESTKQTELVGNLLDLFSKEQTSFMIRTLPKLCLPLIQLAR